VEDGFFALKRRSAWKEGTRSCEGNTIELLFGNFSEYVEGGGEGGVPSLTNFCPVNESTHQSRINASRQNHHHVNVQHVKAVSSCLGHRHIQIEPPGTFDTAMTIHQELLLFLRFFASDDDFGT
jgi:hypothetical protein